MDNTKCYLLFILFGIQLMCISKKVEHLKEPPVFTNFLIEPISIPNHHYRGLHVVDDNLIWASGTESTIIKTMDGGDTWQEFQIPAAQGRDLRDLYAWNQNEAIVLAVGDTAWIFRTNNGGTSWRKVYEDYQPGVFIDAIDFAGDKGYVLGDAIDGHLYILKSESKGNEWTRIEPENLPLAAGQEGAFAASGTNLVLRDDWVFAGTGAGSNPRLIFKHLDSASWSHSDVPLQAGPLGGIYSIVFPDSESGVAVGGNFRDSTRRDSVCAFTINRGKTWNLVPAEDGPAGFRSCVAFHAEKEVFFTCGRTGLDYSLDMGYWINISSEGGYYACSFSQNFLWLIGRNGKCGKVAL